MKIILKLIISISALVLFSACGGDSSNGEVFGDNADSVTQMEINTSYPLSAGNKVVPDGPSTIVVEHTLNDNTKSVQLTSGSAILLKGAYALQ